MYFPGHRFSDIQAAPNTPPLELSHHDCLFPSLNNRNVGHSWAESILDVNNASKVYNYIRIIYKSIFSINVNFANII